MQISSPLNPPSIRAFERCFWAAIFLSIVETVIGWEDFVTFDDGSPVPLLGTALILGVLAMAYGLSIWLWFRITRRASQLARWLYVGLGIVGQGLTLWMFDEIYGQRDAAFAISMIVWALDVASIIFLFRRDSADWFQRKIWLNPATFE